MSNIGHNNPPSDEQFSGNVFCIHRGIFTHDLVGCGNAVRNPQTDKYGWSRFEAWLDIVAMAHWKDTTIKLDGQQYEIARGDLIGGRKKLSQRWGWTEKQVRLFLDKLEKRAMLFKKQGQAKGRATNVLSVSNYCKYQFGLYDEGRNKGQAPPEKGPLKEKYKKLIPSELSKSSDAVSRAFEAYNKLAEQTGLPRAQKLTSQRKQKIKARLQEAGVEGWTKALSMIERSAFLCGQNDNGWKASLDFMLQPSSFTKLLEGTYGNGRHATSKSPSAQQQMQMIIGNQNGGLT